MGEEGRLEAARGAILKKLEKAGPRGAGSLWTASTAPARRTALAEALAALEEEEQVWVDRRRAKVRYFARAHRPALPTAEAVAQRLERMAVADLPALSTRARWKVALKKEPAEAALLEEALACLLHAGRLMLLHYRKPKGPEEVFLPRAAFSPAGPQPQLPDPAEVRRAGAELAAESGFPAVDIAALQARSGASLSALQAWLLAEHQAGRAILSRGDWSLAEEARRAAAVTWQGQPHLLVRLL